MEQNYNASLHVEVAGSIYLLLLFILFNLYSIHLLNLSILLWGIVCQASSFMCQNIGISISFFLSIPLFSLCFYISDSRCLIHPYIRNFALLFLSSITLYLTLPLSRSHLSSRSFLSLFLSLSFYPLPASLSLTIRSLLFASVSSYFRYQTLDTRRADALDPTCTFDLLTGNTRYAGSALLLVSRAHSRLCRCEND